MEQAATPSQKRRKRERTERANAILQAAERIMRAGGLHALHMDLVAQEAELAKGTVYLYFKSKEEILGALTLKARRLLLHVFKEAIAMHDSPLEQLKEVVRANYRFFQSDPLYYDLVSLYEANNAMTESEDLKQMVGEITELIVNVCIEAQRKGELAKHLQPGMVAITLWGMTVGMIQLIKVRGGTIAEHQGIEGESILNAYLQILENGWRG